VAPHYDEFLPIVMTARPSPTIAENNLQRQPLNQQFHPGPGPGPRKEVDWIPAFAGMVIEGIFQVNFLAVRQDIR
jgi:hypothetical protein